jgi:hypothetical protein
LSIQRPRPSIEIWMLACSSTPVKAALVNWLPWDSRQLSTARLVQSMIATR